MRQLLPEPIAEVDLTSLITVGDRHPPEGRPWVMANMVMSVDGAYAVDGRSGALSAPADRRVFHALRAAADAILVAAGTARSERYRRPSTPPELAPARERTGRTAPPRLVVVSVSASIPDDQPFLGGEGPEPLLLHPSGAEVDHLPPGVESRAVGRGEVELGSALEGLRADGVEVVLCEGGPRLLGQLHEQDLVDELFVTLSPQLVGGDRVGLLGPAPQVVHQLSLHRLLEDGGSLFLTYRRRR